MIDELWNIKIKAIPHRVGDNEIRYGCSVDFIFPYKK